jgi:hypothetical protein
MTQVPPPPPPEPPPPAQPPAGAAWQPPAPAPAERVRLAYQRRHDTDYLFSFWTAFGWTLLTCGFYGIYIVYQLVRRSREHNLRRLEELDAATTFAWEKATAAGRADELRDRFERIASGLAVLRQMTTDFRDPTIWAVISIFARGVVEIIVFILLDQDLVKHDYNEGLVEHELAAIYGALGASLPTPDPGRLHQAHNYVGRVVAALVSCGIYSIWWLYNVMTELNEHFEHNWAWEDALAGAVQSLA